MKINNTLETKRRKYQCHVLFTFSKIFVKHERIDDKCGITLCTVVADALAAMPSFHLEIRGTYQLSATRANHSFLRPRDLMRENYAFHRARTSVQTGTFSFFFFFQPIFFMLTRWIMKILRVFTLSKDELEMRVNGCKKKKKIYFQNKFFFK